MIPIPSKSVRHSFKSLSHVNRQYVDNNSVHLITKHKSCFYSNQQSFQNSNRFTPSYYHRCDTVFNKNMLDKRQFSHKVFICKVHSSPWLESYRSIVKNEAPYRMASKPQTTHFVK